MTCSQIVRIKKMMMDALNNKALISVKR